MELSPAQRRTLEGLIGVRRPGDPDPDGDPGLEGAIRGKLEAALAEAGVGKRPGAGPAIWITKRRLNDLDRCPGLFQAGILQEGPPFEYSARTAAGTLFHRSIELDVHTERGFDPRSVSERAAGLLVNGDQGFARLWNGLDAFDRSEILADAGRRLALFRDSFPPFSRRWTPQPEMRMRAHLAGGRVVLSGAPDLILGRRSRLAIDFKSGSAWPEHPEDMRFYALLMTLRSGVVPYRVATFFLDSGEWQAEDVTECTLERASQRVVWAVRAVISGAGAAVAQLTPGPHCDWCPRLSACPAAKGRVA